MPRWIHRTTKEVLQSVPSADLPETVDNYIEEPDLSAVRGWPSIYWSITGDTVSLMDQTQRDAVDVAIQGAARDAIADQLDQVEDVLRAFAIVVLDEFNRKSDKINAILDAADNANNLNEFKTAMVAIVDEPQRTITDLKTAVRNKLGT